MKPIIFLAATASLVYCLIFYEPSWMHIMQAGLYSFTVGILFGRKMT